MKIDVDLHVHTHFSNCGLHSIMEVIEGSLKAGMKGIAISDHGPLSFGINIKSPFLLRLAGEINGLRIYKGIEANIVKNGLDIDELGDKIPCFDIITGGFHTNIKRNKDEKYYTKILLKSMERAKRFDIISHPDIKSYPLHIEKMVQACKERGCAVEINNANMLYGKTDFNKTREIIKYVNKYNCPVVINTDAHVYNEFGNMDKAIDFIKENGLDENLVINKTLENVEEWVNKRKTLCN